MKAVLFLSIFSCAFLAKASSQGYYSLHPKQLQQAIKQCPQRSPASVTCEELKDIAIKMDQLSYQLRSNPQLFGQRILAIQQLVAQQENTLQQNSNQPELRTLLAQNKHTLQEYLAIVRWLESPGT